MRLRDLRATVTLVNETEYSINADVSGVRGGWLRLGSVSAHETLEMPEVLDQGSTWTFRFSYGNYEPAEVTVSEKDLADSDWQVEVPAELQERLREQGVPPPP